MSCRQRRRGRAPERSPRPASRARAFCSATRHRPFAPVYERPRRLRCGPQTCRGPSAPSVSRAPRPYSRTSRPRPRATHQYTPARAAHADGHLAASQASRHPTLPRVAQFVVRRQRNEPQRVTVSPLCTGGLAIVATAAALLRPSSCPLSSSSCPPRAPQHRDVAACPGWPELHREDRQQRCSCRPSAAGARRPHLSPVQAPK
jgi:hypothetical protein